jgi:hypothetical protein
MNNCANVCCVASLGKYLKDRSAYCIQVSAALLSDLPALKLEVTVVLEPATRLQGAVVHPSMLMVKASYSEPVTQQLKINTVNYKPIARRLLGKHIPAGANARKSMTSIARQQISKHTLLTEAVLLRGPSKVVIKKGSVEKSQLLSSRKVVGSIPDELIGFFD